MVQTEPLERVLARTEERLLAASTPEALIARREAGRPRVGDEEHARALGAALRADQDADGSWRGDLVTTAESLLLLREIEPDARAADLAAARALAWLISRQGAPGRFGERCVPALHGAGLCHHFSAGFFSPVPEAERLRGVRLVSGGCVVGDANARFAASALALRAVLAWNAGGRDAALHLDALQRALAGWKRWDDGVLSAAARLVGLTAVLDSPAAESAGVERAVELVVRSQRGDGSWPDVDVFQALEVLTHAARRGVGAGALAEAARRCAGLLAVWQQTVGGRREEAPRRSLIAWRALRHALAPPAPEALAT